MHFQSIIHYCTFFHHGFTRKVSFCRSISSLVAVSKQSATVTFEGLKMDLNNTIVIGHHIYGENMAIVVNELTGREEFGGTLSSMV